MRVALRLHESLDVHGARLADAGEVVAAEVDEHHVLGTVLLRGEERLRIPLARRDRARDRVQRSARPSHLTTVSGELPTSAISPSSSRKRYGDGLTRRSAR